MALIRQGSGSSSSSSSSSQPSEGGGDLNLPVGRHSFPLMLSSGSSRPRKLRHATHGRACARARARHFSTAPILFCLLCFVLVTVLGGDYVFSLVRLRSENVPNRPILEGSRNSSNRTEKSLHFGREFRGEEELLAKDSRYWDKDDRRRDGYAISHDSNNKSSDPNLKQGERARNDESNQMDNGERGLRDDETLNVHSKEANRKTEQEGSGGLYNERGRKELQFYGKQYEEYLKQELDSSKKQNLSRDKGKSSSFNHSQHTHLENSTFMQDVFPENNTVQKSFLEEFKGNLPGHGKQQKLSRKGRRKGRRRKRTSIPCEMEFSNTTRGLKEPESRPNFTTFSLNYVMKEEKPVEALNWEPRFAGHQTLQERDNSFKAGENNTIHCGFIQGNDTTLSTGFDLDEDDARFLRSCHIAISSCIFSNSDHIRSPAGNKFTGSFKEDTCFVMFVDQYTLDVMIEEGQEPDGNGYVGLWKVVVVKNVPYTDGRRNGKIPKFLSHRLFPSARYSIWLDSKLRLQIDPELILDYFLWRGGYEYAISNHYDRHCVWEEVQQNKRLNKYNHTVIDEQFTFYQKDGLSRFNPSDPNKILPSNVPEGSFIVRAHTSMSNLFSCIWFNEVERFTSRDQLSFAYTYMKLVRTNPDKSFRLNMFKDCERRGVAKLFRHRAANAKQLQRQ